MPLRLTLFLRRSAILACIVGLAASCATGGAFTRQVAAIERGDTKQSVVQKLGAAGNRQFSGEDEALQYCKLSGAAHLLAAYAEYTVVWLFRDRVTGVTTYRSAEVVAMCREGFKTVHWEEAPRRP